MNINNTLTRLLATTLLAAPLVLSGCSSSSSDSDKASDKTPPNKDQDQGQNQDQNQDPTPQITKTLSGQVIDPYISDAHIFIDLNNNGKHDKGEPKRTTDSQGKFDFGDWPIDVTDALIDEVKLRIMNTGSWQVPNYGLGISLNAKSGDFVQTDAANEVSGIKELVMTPATTLMASHGLTEQDVLASLNALKDSEDKYLLGREITAADLTADPVTLLGNKENLSSITDADLAGIRAYLVLYAVNRTLSAMQILPDAQASFLDVQVKEIWRNLATMVSTGLSTEVLTTAQSNIDAGNDLMKDGIRNNPSAQAEQKSNRLNALKLTVKRKRAVVVGSWTPLKIKPTPKGL